MSKVIRAFQTRAAARAFVDKAKAKYKGINYGAVYMVNQKFRAMLSGEITPEMAEELKGRARTVFEYRE